MAQQLTAMEREGRVVVIWTTPGEKGLLLGSVIIGPLPERKASYWVL
jgi:hypothetical protein